VGEPVSAPRVRFWKLPIASFHPILIDSWAQSAGCLVTQFRSWVLEVDVANQGGGDTPMLHYQADYKFSIPEMVKITGV
jgi:hypothetical protein